LAYVVVAPGPSLTLTAVPLSAAPAVARPVPFEVAPQLAVSSTWMSLAEGGDTQLTGAADAVAVPDRAATVNPEPMANIAAVRAIRLENRLDVRAEEELADEKRGRETENKRKLLHERKRAGAAHGTPPRQSMAASRRSLCNGAAGIR
jgi:hypothetical protein